jgi:hypothetical protein
MTSRTRRWTLLATAFVVSGALAGGVVASQLRDFDDPDALSQAIGEDPLVRVAEIPAAPRAAAHGVFAQFTSTGHFCIWDAPSPTSRQRQGGCNSVEDPLGGQELSVSLAYEGGPDPGTVTDARLFGLASAKVNAVQVLMTDDARRDVPIRGSADIAFAGTAYKALGYRFRARDLERGNGPTAVIAFDSQGVEIARQTTGFGG